MSKIEELIQNLCPDGVVYKNLGSLGRRNKGTPITASRMKELHQEGSPIKIFAGGKTVADFPKDALPERNIINEPSIIVKSRGHIGFEYYDKPFSHKNELWSYTINSTGVHQKFIYYYLLTRIKSLQELARATSVKLPQLSVKDTDSLKIPIPPLEVQKEIVSILDKFTQLEAELSAELEERRKQYEYYRMNLMAPDKGVRYSSLQELCTLITDGSHSSPKAASNGYYMPSVKDMRPYGFDFSSCKKISKEDYEALVRNGCKPLKNDVLIAKDGSMLKYAFTMDEEQELVVLSSIAILRPKIDIINPNYLAHYFGQEKFKETVIRNYSSKGGVPRIVLKNFKKVKIPVPTIAKQNEIAAILDKFERLMSDITGGLPAEISARRQQSEYYRNKLLTFEELKV